MKRSTPIIALLIAALATNLEAQITRQGPPGRVDQGGPGGPGRDRGVPPNLVIEGFLFPPELVMRYQGEIGLQDSQRATLSSAMQQAQSKFVDTQWKLSAEGEKLSRLLQNPTVDETQVLEQVDRILALEREMKRAQMGLMIRVKNTLTAAQQEKLRQLREAERGERGARGEGDRRPEEPEASGN